MELKVNAQKVMNLAALVVDERLQSRVEISEEAVTDYAHAMEAGAKFPAVTVFFDGVSYYLADGFHRYLASKRAEKVSLACDIVNGTFRDALLFSTKANSKHGMRRTNSDKRKAVNKMLDDFEWSQWSNAEIAAHCEVSPSLVKELRAARGEEPEEVKYQTKTGKIATRKAKNKPREEKAEKPEKKQPEPKQDESEELDFDVRDELIETLKKQNTELSDRLAMAAMDATEEEKELAQTTIDELRERIRVLEIELEAVKRSRDTFQNENAQMKKQIAMLQKKLK
jgi:FtsZ-binding cell division protein ZapB